MPRKIIVAFLALIVLLSLSRISNYPLVLSKKTKKGNPPEVKVVARVGKRAINRLTGFSSPYSEITLSGQNLGRKTTADQKGFFAFYDIAIVEGLKEICLLAQDVNLLPSFPTCLPLPETDQNLQIENVLLSPTLSLESGQIAAGKTTKASGMTFPDSEVQVYLFTEQNWSIRLIKSVYAFGLPKYQIKSNQNGYFEFSLPASAPSKNGIFAVSASSIGSSSKSNTLYFQTLGLLGLLKLFLANFLREASAFFASIAKFKLSWIILFELCLLTGIIIILVGRRTKNRQSND